MELSAFAVLLISLMTWFGIGAYLFFVDRKIKTIESKNINKQEKELFE